MSGRPRRRLRIVGGWLGGRLVEVPAVQSGPPVRPTSERAREAVLNMLVSLGAIEGAEVLDLFAGSGALGIEALSSGAAHVTLVDSDAQVCAAVRKTLKALLVDESAAVVCADVMRWLGDFGHGQPVDLAFADPPYAFDSWDELMGLVPAKVLVCESSRRIEPAAPEAPGSPGWQVYRVRRYGKAVITILRRPEG